MTRRKSVRRLPVWASVAITLVALAGVAGAVEWFIRTAPDTVVLDRGPQDGVHVIVADHDWRVVAGNTVMRVAQKTGGALTPRFGYLQYDFLTPQEFGVLNKARRLSADAAMADAVGVSSRQSEELLQQVRRAFALEIPAADRDRLMALFHDWMNASTSSKSNRELDLLHALDDEGDRLAPAARKTTTDAVARINQIVTPAQWRKFDQIGQ